VVKSKFYIKEWEVIEMSWREKKEAQEETVGSTEKLHWIT